VHFAKTKFLSQYFYMEDIPFETVGLVADDVRALEHTYNTLKEKFNIGLPCSVKLHAKNFDLLDDPNLAIESILPLPHPSNNCYLAFARAHIYYNPRRGAGEIIDCYRYKVWGVITSKKDYGRTLIRRETFADRIVGLIHPVELTFKDDKVFDHRYYVVSNNPDKALPAMDWNFRNAVIDIIDEDIVIEMAENTLILGNNGWLDPEQAIKLAEAALKLAPNC
jgi:hypothetical protein